VNFDKYVEGQRVDGFDRVVVRGAGRPTPLTALNEALALRMFALAGEPAERFSYASVSVNGSPRALRLLVEEPDSPFVEAHFPNDGALYKAQAFSRFEDRGDDPAAYEDSFSVESGKKTGLAPLVELMRWVGTADDAAFAAGLEARLDVASFARYAALQNMLLNFDDMAGPGQNYYLFYDLTARRWTVVNWDLNLAFSGAPTQGVFESRSFGGRGGHPLKERFLATPRFRDLYLAQYRALHASLLANGRALQELARLESTIRASGAVDRAALADEAGALRAILEQRAAFLAGELKPQ
jgi:spore coat protein CotH